MEKEYTLDKTDLVTYSQRFRAGRAKLIQARIKGAKLVWWFIIPAILAMGMVLDGGGYGAALSFVAIMVAFTLWQKWYAKKYYEMFFSEEFGKGIIGKHKIILDRDFLIEITEFKKSYFQWSGIEEIVPTSQHLFIYPNKISAIIVPRRIFQSEEETLSFERELSDKWRAGKNAPQGSLLNASSKPAGAPPASSGDIPAAGGL